MELLSEGIAIDLVEPQTAAGTTDVLTADNVDMTGYDGVMFVAVIGTITTTGTATLAVGGAATDTTVGAYSGASAQASAAADSDKLLVVDILRPIHRFVGATLTRATANVVLGGILAIRYQAKNKPTAWTAAKLAADVVSLVSPALA